jgi:hypothetical protein
MPNWWAEYFWSRTHKAQAAFHRGFALGILATLLLLSIASKLLSCESSAQGIVSLGSVLLAPRLAGA